MIKIDSLRTLIAVFFLASLISGCATNAPIAIDKADIHPWMADIINDDSLSSSHPDHIDSIFSVSEEMRKAIEQRFGSLPNRVAVDRLANWLIQEDGLNMDYDIKANLSPIDAYYERRGNCLSFTILLSTLAAELGIDIKYNQVFLPNIWQLEEENGLFLYRHVNALYSAPGRGTMIFDLAMELYDFGYPQKVISRDQIAAKLHSNRGAEELFKGDYEKSFYYFKLALAIAPDDSEIWGNLGSLMKRSQQPIKAEQAMLYSLGLDPNNASSASNLERLYLTQGRTREAEDFAILALNARKTNPYYYYDLARQQYDDGELKQALKSVRKAKRLHNKDPRFYELSSRIFQRQKQYVKALRDMKKAATIASDEANILRYANKAKLVAELAAKDQSTQPRLNFQNIPYPIRMY